MGREKGCVMSKESNLKRSISLKAFNSVNKRKPLTLEQREKISQSLKGKMVKEKHWNWKGDLTHNEEHRRAHKRVWNSNNRKRLNFLKREWEKNKFEKKAGRPRPLNCEVCESDKRISFDHNHQTGKFRGWLCNDCNLALGILKDNPILLRKLADYLEKSETPVTNDEGV